jgi:hypothetical protein
MEKKELEVQKKQEMLFKKKQENRNKLMLSEFM